jgi:hypothetical protein
MQKDEPRPCSRYTISPTETLADLARIYEIDREAYGDDNVSFAVLRDWWQSAPHGHFNIRKSGSAPIGALGIWPVTRESFDLLARGRITEEGVVVAEDCGDTEERWLYLSGIVIAPHARKTPASFCLLRGVFDYWRRHQAFQAMRWHVGAVPITRAGERLLARYGFALSVLAHDRNSPYPFSQREFGASSESLDKEDKRS